MSLDDRYDLSELRNETEHLVFDELEQQLNRIADEDICKCNDCVLDMACYALNHLGPRYRATLTGAIYARVVEDDTVKTVAEQVEEAISRISENPMHG